MPIRALTSILRPDITALEPYTPVVPIEILAERLGIPADQIVKLDANENPFGPAPRAMAALAELGSPTPGATARVAIYPDPDQWRLREALSQYTGQPADRIIVGAGSDEVIDLLMRACLRPGEVLLDCPPTFGMYAFGAALYAARVVEVARDAHYDLDLEGIADAAEREQAKLIFIAAPNNPTGNPVQREAILRLLELPMIVVVDEAYAEFTGSSMVDLVGQYPNLVVLRTFSKWAGLAGLRVGYGIFHPELIGHLLKIKQPYTVNVAAEVAALASLEDIEYLRRNVAHIVAERERLYSALRELPELQVYPSSANFLLCRIRPTGEQPAVARAAAIKEALMKRGILVRYYRKPGLNDCLRFSIGTPAQNDIVLAALKEIM